MNNWILERWRHLKSIGKLWWFLAYSAWAAFWTIQECIEKWGSDKWKAAWSAATLHLPGGISTLLIGTLAITVAVVIDGSYRHHKTLADVIRGLTWPKDRPILVFEKWGEVPHDHPNARFHEATSYNPQREYFERGFFIINDGESAAHDVRVYPISLTNTISARGDVVPRIASKGTGFAFIWMDLENNPKFMDIPSRWDLKEAMAIIEEKQNAARVEAQSLSTEVGICYRDADNIWYISWAPMTYIQDTDHIEFGPTEQKRGGLTPPW